MLQQHKDENDLLKKRLFNLFNSVKTKNLFSNLNNLLILAANRNLVTFF